MENTPDCKYHREGLKNLFLEKLRQRKSELSGYLNYVQRTYQGTAEIDYYWVANINRLLDDNSSFIEKINQSNSVNLQNDIYSILRSIDNHYHYNKILFDACALHRETSLTSNTHVNYEQHPFLKNVLEVNTNSDKSGSKINESPAVIKD